MKPSQLRSVIYLASIDDLTKRLTDETTPTSRGTYEGVSRNLLKCPLEWGVQPTWSGSGWSAVVAIRWVWRKALMASYAVSSLARLVKPWPSSG